MIISVYTRRQNTDRKKDGHPSRLTGCVRLHFAFFLLLFLSSGHVPGIEASPGDIDDSQMVSPKDAILALKSISGNDTPVISGEADVDGDGRIGIPEAIFALKSSLTEAPAPLVLSNCDSLLDWNAGEISTAEKVEGTGSLRWSHGDVSVLSLVNPESDFSAHKTLSFRLHSNVANDQNFMLIVTSENASTSGMDYYSKEIMADFTGWKHFEFDLAQFSAVRSPLSWDDITAFYFTAAGWGNEPNPDNIILVDDLVLTGTAPVPRDVFANLNRIHPRLIIPGGDWSAIKAKITGDAHTQDGLAHLLSVADGILDDPVSTYSIPDGIRLLATSRQVLSRIYTLALAYRMTDDDDYLNRVWDELYAAANFPDWNPSHFLDTAEMTHAFAIGYDWLFDVWTTEQKEVIRNAIIDFGLIPYLAAHEEHASWLTSESNWNMVTNGGIGLGALAIAETDTQLSWDIINKTLTSMENAESIATLGPDGAWYEGPGYWSYATKYLFIYAAALESAVDSTFYILDVPGVSVTGNFPVYMTSPTTNIFNFADCGDWPIRAPWLYWLDMKFDKPLYSWFQTKFSLDHALDLIWYKPDNSSPAELGLELDAYFRKTEAVTLRSAWGDDNALFAGFKAGNNNVGHGHLDLGEFVFDALGERWVFDLGPDDYNLPGYFSQSGEFDDQRWHYYRLRAEGNNTLVINPDALADQDPSAETEIISFTSDHDGTGAAIADLTDAYDEMGASRVWRGIALINTRTQMLLQDEIVTDNPSEVWWFMNIHDGTDVEFHDDRKRAILIQNGKQIEVRILNPDIGGFFLQDGSPLPTSPHPAGQRLTDQKLSIHVTSETDVTIPVLFTPITESGMVIDLPE
ncbi:MAG: heparinase II/III family protein, partial [Desulfofustis sp.]|nr:heparinase II/III family protein [Desulfofustis sp.]